MDKKMFENVIIYSMAEPGAMGVGGRMEFVTDRGEDFELWYMTDDTPYQEIKKAFPALKDCYWNGPSKACSKNEPREIVFYSDKAKRIYECTRVTEGWQHIYMGFGNHLVIRADHYEEFMDAISDLEEGLHIYGNWRERALKLYRK